ncbi:flagellar protein FliT [Caballeronia grimmiae]|uniref:flagellar protein FliT n=1 Tax=Caballeronia grimmiae TaxID=1071679 RepID=UPI0038BBE25E
MDQIDLLSRVWTLTEAIEHAAAIADWPTAASLAEQRSPLLMSVSGCQSSDAMAVINRIRATDAVIMANAELTRRELQAEFQEALRYSNAAHQYQQVALI